MDLVITGYVLGTFGVEGVIKVASCSGEYEHFLNLKKVYITFSKRKIGSNKYKDGWYSIEKVRIVKGCVLLKIEGLTSLEEAKYFVGGQLSVDKSEACLLKDNEFYACDLCSCVLLLKKNVCGKIANVVDGGSGVLLEVLKNDGVSCYVPFNNEFIGDVDINKKNIELKNGWILE